MIGLQLIGIEPLYARHRIPGMTVPDHNPSTSSLKQAALLDSLAHGSVLVPTALGGTALLAAFALASSNPLFWLGGWPVWPSVVRRGLATGEAISGGGQSIAPENAAGPDQPTRAGTPAIT